MVEWEKVKLGDISEIRMCRRIFSWQTTRSGDIPFFKIGTFGKQPDAYISNTLYKEYKSRYSFPEEGDILLSASGTIGRAVIFDGKPSYFQDSNIIWLIINKEKICNEYLYYCYQIITWPFPEGSTISRLYNGIIHITEILLPPLSEQHCMATILSDTDSYISALEKLIAKKRVVKQGVMQELLTGKRRLPGFSGEWVERPLRDFGVCIRGVSYNPCSDLSNFASSNTTILLRANNIVEESIVYCDVQYVNDSTVSEVQKLQQGDILIAMSSGSRFAVGKTGSFTKTTGKYCVGAFCATFRSSFNSYIRYLFQSDIYQNQLSSILEGTSINNLSGKQIEGLYFPFAPTINEQNAITEILSEMDAEIDVLSAKLAKANQIKQGMMSELLTGRIRLVEDNVTTGIVSDITPQTLPISKPKSKRHNQDIEDAVIFGGIVNYFYHPDIPLGRFKVQKLVYLCRRFYGKSTTDFKKNVAGPYNDRMRYKGGEQIAVENKYITRQSNEKGSIFGIGENINGALKYIRDWGFDDGVNWLVDRFHFIKADKLELLTTVDMAICDLEKEKKPVMLETIKYYIASIKEWKPKLEKPNFDDDCIVQAINELAVLFPKE